MFLSYVCRALQCASARLCHSVIDACLKILADNDCTETAHLRLLAKGGAVFPDGTQGARKGLVLQVIEAYAGAQAYERGGHPVADMGEEGVLKHFCQHPCGCVGSPVSLCQASATARSCNYSSCSWRS